MGLNISLQVSVQFQSQVQSKHLKDHELQKLGKTLLTARNKRSIAKAVMSCPTIRKHIENILLCDVSREAQLLCSRKHRFVFYFHWLRCTGKY